jgi:hypothetical protein
MSDSDYNATLSADQFYAQGVVNIVRDFVGEFSSRGELNALRRIVEDGEDLQGGVVGQMPERFTEDKLIRPLLEALGYEGIVSQPADLVQDQRSVPDFKTGGVAESCVCIIEAKRLGRLALSDEQHIVEDEILEYLGENALTKYKRDLDTQYLMGIGTDGVVWILYAKNLNTGERTAIQAASLREPIRQAVLSQQYDGEPGDSWVTDQRPYIKKEFVQYFTADSASAATTAALNNE